MAEKKNTAIEVAERIGKAIGLMAVLGSAVLLFMNLGEMKKDAETRMFEDAKQKEKTRSHIDSDYNEVKNYQLMEEQKQMKIELDTAYAFVNAMFKTDRAARKLDSANSANAKISRIKRDSIFLLQAKEIIEIKKDNSRMENAVQLILSNQQKILDTIR